MRRLLAVLLLALGGLAGPAVASHGEIVVVADGSASGVLDLPSSVRLDLSGLRFETRGSYAVVAFAQRGDAVNYMLALPGVAGYRHYSTNHLPKGRTLVRVVADARTTLVLPVLNMHGRRTVRTTRGLPGGTGVVRTARPDANNDVVDDIRFVARGRSLIVHAVSRPHQQEVAATDSTCVQAGDAPCPVVPDVRVWPRQSTSGGYSMSVWDPAGQAHAYHRSTAVGVGPQPLQHGLVVVPVE